MEFPCLHQNSYEAVQNTVVERIKCSKPKILKNLAVLCTGTLLLFTSYDALTMLQSTMNRKDGIGVISQATVYAVFCVSATLLPKFFISKFGSKNTSVAAMFGYLPNIASNYYPHWSLMIPSSIVLGIAGPLLWASHGVYLNELSMLYSSQREPIVEESIQYKSEKKDGKKMLHEDKIHHKDTAPCSVEDTIKLTHSVSGYASIIPSHKREESMDTSFTRSNSSNIFSGEIKYDKSKDTSYQKSHIRRKSGDAFMIRSHSSNVISDEIKYGKSKESSRSQSTKNLNTRDIPTIKSKTSQLVMDKKKYNENTDSSLLQSKKGLDSRVTSMIRPKTSNLISESKISKKTHKGVVNSSTSRFYDTGIHQSQSNVSFEGNNNGNETKRLLAKSESSFLSSTTAKFFGFHGMSHLTSHIWSSLLSYLTLKSDVFIVDFSNSSCDCGADFCSVISECFESNAGNPSSHVRNTLISICVAMCLFSILIVGVFLDALDENKRLIYFSFEFCNATCTILRKKELLLLIPLSIHTGLVQGFYVGDFNKSYVACAWGTYHVGLVAIVYGVACGVSSLLSGWCVRHCGRKPVFTAAAVVNVVSVVFLLLWTPDSKFPKMFFFASGLWGIHVGIVWSQLRAFYGVLFSSDDEAAFSAFHLWSGLGFCIAFGFSNFFCISHKLYAILTVSVLGFAGYYTVELIYCKNNKE